MAFNSGAGGKGSARRSSQVSMETVDANFDRIFGKKKIESKPPQSNLIEESNVICERLLDSEEHACEAAIPPIAEEAVEMIRKLQNEIETLKCRLHTTKQ